MSEPRAPRWPLAAGERALFARHLASLSRTELTPDTVRWIARSGLGSAGLRMNAELLAHRLESGAPLSQAIGSLDASFGAEDEAIIAAGERTGDVARALDAWGELLANRADDEKLLRQALIQPACVLGVVIVSASALAGVIMPTLATIYVEAGGTLPAATRLALSIGRIGPALVLTSVAAAILALITWLWRDAMDPRVLRVHDRLALALPGLSGIEARATRWLLLDALAAAARAGQAPQDAFERAAAMQRNVVLSEELARAAQSLRSGEALRPRGRVLDAATTDAITRALSRPDASVALDRLATREKLSVRRAIRRLDALVRPALTIATGILAAIVVIGSYAALFALPVLPGLTP